LRVVTGVILNVINGVLKLINLLIKIAFFIIEKIIFTMYRGVGELLESAYKITHRLIAMRVAR